MTAWELENRGVQFLGGHPPRVRGPRELAETTRAEVARRIPAMREMPPATGYGNCDGCRDALKPGRGGLCSLCSLARHKALEGA